MSDKLKLDWPSDFWGYKWIGHCWYIESVDGDMLLGDGLPIDEKVAQAYCRCANIARSQAMSEFKSKVFKVLDRGML